MCLRSTRIYTHHKQIVRDYRHKKKFLMHAYCIWRSKFQLHNSITVSSLPTCRALQHFPISDQKLRPIGSGSILNVLCALSLPLQLESMDFTLMGGGGGSVKTNMIRQLSRHFPSWKLYLIDSSFKTTDPLSKKFHLYKKLSFLILMLWADS